MQSESEPRMAGYLVSSPIFPSMRAQEARGTLPRSIHESPYALPSSPSMNGPKCTAQEILRKQQQGSAKDSIFLSRSREVRLSVRFVLAGGVYLWRWGRCFWGNGFLLSFRFYQRVDQVHAALLAPVPPASRLPRNICLWAT